MRNGCVTGPPVKALNAGPVNVVGADSVTAVGGDSVPFAAAPPDVNVLGSRHGADVALVADAASPADASADAVRSPCGDTGVLPSADPA